MQVGIFAGYVQGVEADQGIGQRGVDAALALPLYLRDKVALKTSEREEARSTSTGSV